jgi:hypothetical protein
MRHYYCHAASPSECGMSKWARFVSKFTFSLKGTAATTTLKIWDSHKDHGANINSLGVQIHRPMLYIVPDRLSAYDIGVIFPDMPWDSIN